MVASVQIVTIPSSSDVLDDGVNVTQIGSNDLEHIGISTVPVRGKNWINHIRSSDSQTTRRKYSYCEGMYRMMRFFPSQQKMAKATEA